MYTSIEIQHKKIQYKKQQTKKTKYLALAYSKYLLSIIYYTLKVYAIGILPSVPLRYYIPYVFASTGNIILVLF